VHDERDADARVLLIPRHALRTAGAHAVVEERVLEDVARSA
jgi:3-deoxy-D-manno-octulosonic-acid transferase